MKIAYFDCFAGISGDMMVGALIDLGLDPERLNQELQKLPVDGYRLEVSKVDKLGIQATKFDVFLTGVEQERLADAEFQEVEGPGHHDSSPETSAPSHLAHQHRTLRDILGIIEASSLSLNVKSMAGQIFTRLGEAEAKAHGVALDQVHFHEVGGVDAIVDIVGTAIGIEYLGLEQIYASPLQLGSGFVRCAHGLYPIPGPATANLLKGVPVYSGQTKGELVTPTGAAIITTLAAEFGPMPAMITQAIGYGAGSREREFPNVLRGFLGEPASPAAAATSAPSRQVRTPFPEQHAASQSAAGYHEAQAIVIESNIDDMNPQLFEYLTERLLAAGALDVILIPVQMKKGRPGTLLQLLAHPSSVDELTGIIFTESTTIGVRTYEVTKRMLQREIQTVETPYGPVRVKVARLGERVVNVAPEYEDCLALARRPRRTGEGDLSGTQSIDNEQCGAFAALAAQ